MKTIYMARTRYLGADGPTECYFRTEAAARRMITENDNIGEVEEVYCTIDINNGMTYQDILYWGGEIHEA